MGSSRLPGKVMAPLSGCPMLEHIVMRLRHCPWLDKIVIATTTAPQDETIVQWAQQKGLDCWQGPEENVLGRICQAAESLDSEMIVHATADNPLVDPEMITFALQQVEDKDFDLACMPGLPLGLGVDIFRKAALKKADQLATKAAHREHVNSFFFDHPEYFTILCLPTPADRRASGLRLTVDTPEDMTLMQKIYQHLGRPGKIIATKEVLGLYHQDQAFFQDNQDIKQHYVSHRLKKLREHG